MVGSTNLSNPRDLPLYLTFCVSGSLWASLLAWSIFTPIRFSGAVAVALFGGGWHIAWWRRRRSLSYGRLIGPRALQLTTYVLGAIEAITLLISLWAP